MTDLNFAKGLTQNLFAWGNEYITTPLNKTGLYFSKEMLPYIMTGGISDTSELQFCQYSLQFRGRVLSGKKIKEIMNTCPIPIRVTVNNCRYLMGKGFLARSILDNALGDLLFVACVNLNNPYTINDIKFFIDRKLYNESNKVFHTVIKDILRDFKGDVIICSDILSYIGVKITLPQGGSIASRKLYTDNLVKATFEEIIRKRQADHPIVVSSTAVEQENTLDLEWEYSEEDEVEEDEFEEDEVEQYDGENPD